MKIKLTFSSALKEHIVEKYADYKMGARPLKRALSQVVEDQLSEECRGRVDIEAKTCLELCERDNLGGAPYVRFNGSEIMSQATPEKVLARIRELVEGIA